MVWRKKTRLSDEEWKLQNLCYLIVQLDSIRAFKRVDLTQTEESFQEIDRLKLWDEIHPDLETIVYFPQTLPRAFKLMQFAAFMRRLFPICFFSVILVLLSKAGFIPLRLSPIASLLLLVVPFAIVIAFVYVDLFIRRTIIRYEREHPNMQSKQKEHIKQVVEQLVVVLHKWIKDQGENVGDYRMKLHFDDYAGMRVLQEVRGKLFRRKHPTYLTVPATTDS
jgi:hypothetical protein